MYEADFRLVSLDRDQAGFKIVRYRPRHIPTEAVRVMRRTWLVFRGSEVGRVATSAKNSTTRSSITSD